MKGQPPKPWQPLSRARLIPKSPEQLLALFEHSKASFPEKSDDEIWGTIAAARSELGELWKNDQYQVHVIRWEGRGPAGCDVVQLSIKRLDQQWPRDWRHFQAIKDQLMGPEYEAVELYPARSRLVDTANQFHLWCIDDPAYRWPIGYTEGHLSGASGGGAVQRPLSAPPPEQEPPKP